VQQATGPRVRGEVAAATERCAIDPGTCNEGISRQRPQGCDVRHRVPAAVTSGRKPPVVLGQTVGDLPPWHLENMQLGGLDRIIIQQPSRNADGCELRRFAGTIARSNCRRGKVSEAPRRRFEALNQFPAGDEPNLSVSTCAWLAKAAPLSLRQLLECHESGPHHIDLKSDAAAEVASPDQRGPTNLPHFGFDDCQP
jgi:hypothetical protein